LGGGWAWCVGVKLNVVQKRWLCVSACTSFNFTKRWLSYRFCQTFNVRRVFLGVAGNGFGLGEGGDFHHKC